MGARLQLKIILRADKRRYVLVASAAECSEMLDNGMVIENVHDYDNKAVRSNRNKTKIDNLRALTKLNKRLIDIDNLSGYKRKKLKA